MIAAYVANGVKSGLVAGLAFGLLVALVANPLVAFAEGSAHVEGAGGHDHAGDSHGEGGLSASVADGASVLSGVLWGVFLGVVAFGVAFYLLEPIVPGSGAVRSYAFGAAGLLTASVAPWLAFPPGPPGNVGRRGGSGLAAGLTNELVHVASDARDGGVEL